MSMDLVFLPDELPASFDSSKLEHEASHNHAVAELIAQNRDLHSRLSVNLLRNGELEQRCKKLQSKIQDLAHLNEQVSEASLSNRTKCESLEKDNANLRERLKIFHEEFEAMNLDLKQQGKTFAEQIRDFKTQIAALNKYRAKIKAFTKPMLNELKAKVEVRDQRISELENRNYDLTEALKQLTVQFRKFQIDASEHSANIQHSKEQVVAAYLAEITQLENKIQMMNHDFKQTKKRNEYLEGIQERISIAENRAIKLEREKHSIEKKLQDEIQYLKIQLGHERRNESLQSNIEYRIPNKNIFQPSSAPELSSVNTLVDEKEDFSWNKKNMKNIDSFSTQNNSIPQLPDSIPAGLDFT